MTTPERSVRSVRFPAAYGAPGGPESLLPSISAHLSSEAEAIILEGTAEYVTEPSHSLAAPSAAASKEKYPQHFSGNAAPFRPFWALRPTTALASTLEGFPRGATRWRFPTRCACRITSGRGGDK